MWTISGEAAQAKSDSRHGAHADAMGICSSVMHKISKKTRQRFIQNTRMSVLSAQQTSCSAEEAKLYQSAEGRLAVAQAFGGCC